MIDRDRLVQTFCDIVRIDSPSGEEDAIAADLRARLEELKFAVEEDANGNLVASEGGDEPLMLSAHMDTVEPGRGIKPSVAGDRIVSDGTTILGGDCKAGVAAILEALESVREQDLQHRPVQIVLTRGEEVGLLGARGLDMSMVRARNGVVFDGNGPVSRVTIASPTYMKFDVAITGRGAHAGVEPEKGLSAIRVAVDIISRLPQGRLDEETTFNVGTIQGGTVRNAVPEEASFSGEFRSRNMETFDLLTMQVREALDETRRDYREAVIRDEIEIEFHMYTLGPDDAMVRMASKVLEDVGLRAVLEPSGGGTDANVFNRMGIPSVVVGMSTNEMHTVREYVSVPDLMDTARFCEALLRV